MERRIIRHSSRLSQQHEGALDAGFHVGQRVRTLDGLIGRIIEITESFSPGANQYQVILDSGQGGGTFLGSQLRPVPDDYGGGHQAPAHLPAGVTAALEAEAELEHTADQDYPEMGSVLSDRPDPGRQFTVIGARHQAVPIPGGQLKLFHQQHELPDTCPGCGYERRDPEHNFLHLRHVQTERGEYEPDECEHCGHDLNAEGEHAQAHHDWLTSQDWYTDWDHEGPGDTIHRGISASLPPEVHAVVHDESRSARERAKALTGHLLSQENLGGSGLGNFFSGDPDVSKTYAETHQRRFGQHGEPQTPVMLHVHTPDREHFETDPDELRSMGVYSYHLAGNREVPIQNQAPLRIKGISWAPPGHRQGTMTHHTPEWFEPGPHHLDQDPAWTHHEFGGEGIRAHAHFKEDEDRDREDPESHNHGWCWACQEHHGSEEEAEEHDQASTDWRNGTYKDLPSRMYRGLALSLPSGLHEHVHDPDTPVAQRAEMLNDHLRHYWHPLGTHWSATQDQAEHYANVSSYHHKGGSYSKVDPSITHVVIHARKPKLRDIEKDPYTLAEQGVIGHDYHDDAEIPMQGGAPVHVAGLSWQRDGDSEYTHHAFRAHHEHLAATYADGLDPREDEYNGEPPVGGVYWGAPAQQAFVDEELGQPEDPMLMEPGGPEDEEPPPFQATAAGGLFPWNTPEGQKHMVFHMMQRHKYTMKRASESGGGIWDEHRALHEQGGQSHDHDWPLEDRFQPMIPVHKKLPAFQPGLGGAAENPRPTPTGLWKGGEIPEDHPLYPHMEDFQPRHQSDNPRAVLSSRTASAWQPGEERDIDKYRMQQSGGPHQLSAREERGDRWHEYGNRYSTDLHRGIVAILPPDVHEAVHDESRPVAERAQVLSEHFSGSGLGMHWTPHTQIAQRASGNAADREYPPWYAYQDDNEAYPKTHVMFHVRQPAQRSILRNRDELERHQVGWAHSKDEDETPVKEGSPLFMTGISWKLHEPEYPMEPYEHHDFAKPIRHTASYDCLRETMQQVREASCPASGPEVLRGLPRDLHEGMAQDPQAQRGAAAQGDHPGLYQGADQAWEADPRAVHPVQVRASGGASPGLHETPLGRMAVRAASQAASLAAEAGPAWSRLARVPWTPEQREQLHSWQASPTATEGDFVNSNLFTNKMPEYVPEPDPEQQYAEAIGPRAFTELTAKLALHDPHDPVADKVYQLLSKKFPPEATSWVHDAKWEGPGRVPLDQIDFSNRDSWAASSDPKKVKKARKKIEKKEKKGKDPKPAILVRRPGKDTAMIADGHHRALAEEQLAADDDGREGLHAWTAHVDEAEGPWDQMHASQHEEGEEPEPPIEGTEDELAPGPEGTGQEPAGPGGEDTAPFEPGDAPGNPLPRNPLQPMPPALITGLPPLSQGGTPGPRTKNTAPVEPVTTVKPVKSGKPGKDDPGEKDQALDSFEKAAASAPFRFEFTAAWRDVVAKAERIIRENGVRITALAGSLTVGEVKGDHATYETGLQYYPGRGFSVMAYSCGCPWASFHQDPDYPGRFAGRMCSHAYALSLEARKRGVVQKTMFPEQAGWPEQVVTKSWPPFEHDDKQWAQQWTAPMTRRPVLSSRSAAEDEPPAVTAARVLTGAGEDPAAVAVLLSCAGLAIEAVSHPLSWDEIGERHPGLYGDPGVHGEAAEGADGEGVGWAANILANDRPGDPDAQNSGAWDLTFHREKVWPHHIDYAHHENDDPRVQRAYQGYLNHPERVPPTILVHRHGVYQVADGHHRAQGAERANKPVDAYVHYSEHEDTPFSRDEDGAERKGPFHGARPSPGVAAHRNYFRRQADQANAPWGSQNVVDSPPPGPYGATSPPEKDRDPGSYGPLSGPDPDNWGEIQDNSAIQMPLTSDAARHSYAMFIDTEPPSSDSIHAVAAPGGGPGRNGTARQAAGPALDTATMDTNAEPATRDWGESYPYADRAATAGPSTSVTPRDPAGLRFEEALTAARRAFTASMNASAAAAEPQLDGALAELKDEPEPALDPEGLTANSEENPQNPWGNPRQATYEDAKAYNLARTLPHYPEAGSTTDAGRAQHPSQVTQQPGPGSMDEPYSPDDSSIQTAGAQAAWARDYIRQRYGQAQSGGLDVDSTDAAVAGQGQENPVEGENADIVRQFQASAAARQYAGDGSAPGSSSDIAAAARAFLKTADVLPAEEADELIREGRGTRARNLDLLDLQGTHYTDDSRLDEHDDDIIYA